MNLEDEPLKIKKQIMKLELTEKITWDHSQNDIAKALHITDDRALEITGSLLFTEIDKAFTAHSLFDNEDEIPAGFKSKTAVLDSVLDDLTNNNEAIFATYEWTKFIVARNMGADKDKMNAQLTMLYMMSGQNKEKFLNEFRRRASKD